MSKIHNTDKVLEFLLSNKKDEFTIRAIALATKLDYKVAYLTIQDLIKKNTINAKKVGQTILCSINRKTFNSDIFRAELLRQEEILKKKDLAVMHDYIKDIGEQFFILLLFGSYAEGKNQKGSDIDLMLITDINSIKTDTKRILSRLPLKIHLNTFTSKEFVSMLKTTDFNVGKEAYDNNIILFGTEDFYRLTQNA